MNNESIVSAEVLMRESTKTTANAAVEKVASRLQELGLKVLSVGKRSISVEGPKALFESLFKCELVESEEKTFPGSDFGLLSGTSLRATRPLEVPAELQDEVDSIEPQESAILF